MQNSKSSWISQRTALVWLLFAAGIFYLIFTLRAAFRIRGELYFTLIDDAMVSMRYAQHLAQGHGLVWNVGGTPVEGFTNLGWTLVMALCQLLPLPASKVSLVVILVAAAILLANTGVVYGICRRLSPTAPYAPLMAAAITAFYFPMVFWSLRGMEVGMLTLLVNLALLLLLSPREDRGWGIFIIVALILSLALIVRMDSIIQVSLILAYAMSRAKPNLRRGALAAGMVALVLIGILWFQRFYFGDALPNTYYQKVVGASAYERIKNGLLVFTQYATRDTLMLVLVSVAGVLLYKDLRSRETALLAGLFLVQCTYSVWVGGDYAEPEVASANRFIAQGMPALVILFSLCADRMLSDLLAARAVDTKRARPAPAFLSVGIAIGVLAVISGQPWINWTIDNAPLLKADIRRVKVGLSIAENTSPIATIAVHAAGQIPYFSNRMTIDLLGLNDPTIAKGPLAGPFYPGHDKWNYDYSIMQLKPDLIADNWIKLGDFMRDKGEYQQLDNGMYVRRDSTLVDVAGLLESFP